MYNFMNPSFDIIESPETLLNILKQQTDKWCFLKVKALYLLKTEQVKDLK